jgi:hypothetical protein
LAKKRGTRLRTISEEMSMRKLVRLAAKTFRGSSFSFIEKEV